MKRIPCNLLVGLVIPAIWLGLIAPGTALAAASGDTGSETQPALPSPSVNDQILLDVNWTAEDQADYDLECPERRDERRVTIHGDLVITSAGQPEKFRCARFITGDLVVQANGDMDWIVFPYLQKVYGEVRLKSAAWFDRARFPRLFHVGGRLFVDQRLFQSEWELPALLTHAGLLEVLSGVVNPLDGFDQLQSLGSLELRRHPNDIYGPFSFSGLNALTTVSGNLVIDLPSGKSSGAFLQALDSVGGDVDIELGDGAVFGLEPLRVVGGNLSVVRHGDGWSGTAGLSGLESVGGDFTWSGSSIGDLSGLNQLVQVGGDLALDYATNDLSGLSALQSVGSLQIRYAALQSLHGLNSLASLGELVVEDNYSLTDVSALSAASVPATGAIRIVDNWNLSDCDARALVRALRQDPNWNTWNTAHTSVQGNQACRTLSGTRR